MGEKKAVFFREKHPTGRDPVMNANPEELRSMLTKAYNKLEAAKDLYEK